MIFHNPQRKIDSHSNYSFLVEQPSHLKIDDLPIKRVQSHLFLGLKVHENLSWNTHLDYISKKIAKTIGILKHTKSFLPANILKTLYNTLILPHLHYGILVWGFHCEKLLSIQKECMRLITKSFPLEHTEKLFKSCNVLKINDIFKLKLLTFFYKYRNNELPFYLSHMFNLSNTNTHYTLRSANNRIMTEISTNLICTEKSLRFHLPKFINNLESDFHALFSLSNLSTLKFKTKQLLLSKYSSLPCQIRNCYSCGQRLFFLFYSSAFIQYIHPISYMS